MVIFVCCCCLLLLGMSYLDNGYVFVGCRQREHAAKVDTHKETLREERERSEHRIKEVATLQLQLTTAKKEYGALQETTLAEKKTVEDNHARLNVELADKQKYIQLLATKMKEMQQAAAAAAPNDGDEQRAKEEEEARTAEAVAEAVGEAVVETPAEAVAEAVAAAACGSAGAMR